MTLGNQRTPSPSELEAQTKLDSWLKRTHPNAITQWIFEPNNPYTPPDFQLTSDRTSYNVEVAIVEWQNPTDRNPQSDTGWDAQFHSFRDEVVDDCKARNALHGSYNISVKNPLQRGRDSRFVKQAMRDYIQNTQHQDTAPTTEFHLGDSLIFEIRKIGSQPDVVGIGDFGRKGPSADFCTHLEGEINDKIKALAQVSAPRVLVLRDHYFLATPSHWDACLSNTKGKEFFDAIFVITGHDHDYLLHSRIDGWPEIDKNGSYYDTGTEIPGWGQ